MIRLRSLTRRAMFSGIVALLLCGLSPAVASAQSVRGHSKVDLGNGGLLPDLIAVDAWLDDNNGAHGMVIWGGDVPPGLPKTGPVDPWLIAVTDIIFDGNTAYVTGIVAHSVFPWEVGIETFFTFTDNSGTGEPDEIDGVPIVAGNITVQN